MYWSQWPAAVTASANTTYQYSLLSNFVLHQILPTQSLRSLPGG
jgi:hypothetical protein